MMKQKDTQGGDRWSRTAWALAGCRPTEQVKRKKNKTDRCVWKKKDKKTPTRSRESGLKDDGGARGAVELCLKP